MTAGFTRNRLAPMMLGALMAAAALCLAACRGPETAPQKTAGIHEIFRNKDASLTMMADRAAMTTADRLEVAVTLEVPPGHEAALPDKLPGPVEKEPAFTLVEASAPTQELMPDGRLQIRRTYLLEPFLAGTYAIPGLKVDVRKPGDEAATLTIETRPIPVAVSSLLPKAGEGLKPHDIRPPAGLPPALSPWAWGAGGALLVVFAGLGVFFMSRLRKARLVAAEIVVPPHEAALSALDALMEGRLLEKGEIKVFYQEISGILRRYIEARFGLRAPEQTTEEFLDSLKTGAGLDRRYQGLLKQFLTHCDLVKFAAHQPSGEDIRNTIDSCRVFVQETRLPGETQ